MHEKGQCREDTDICFIKDRFDEEMRSRVKIHFLHARKRSSMATLKDVAKETGLTVSTVSRVLNNRGYISEETRKKYMRQ